VILLTISASPAEAKQFLVSCMFCKYPSQCTILSFVRGLHRNHMLLIIMLMILHVLQAKPFLLFCMFCNTRAKMHTILVSFVACTEITEIARFDSAHDFWMFCRQNNFLLLKSGEFGPFFPWKILVFSG
jgi:hypothetical protein